MTLEMSKTLGGVGALLVVIGALGFFGTGYAGLLSLIGVILTLIALKGFADHYSEGGIFNNALYGFILIIIGGVATVAALFFTALTLLADLGFDLANLTDMAALQGNWQSLIDPSTLMNLVGGIIISLVVLFVFFIISAIFFRKSLSSLSEKTGVGLFQTAGLIWLIGAVLTIILVGVILIWIAWILIAVGFFSIKTTTAQAPQPPPPTQ